VFYKNKENEKSQRKRQWGGGREPHGGLRKALRRAEEGVVSVLAKEGRKKM
jgi:hypothetical protein